MKVPTIKSLISASILGLIAAGIPARANDTSVLEQLAAHNVVWDSPSQDMHGSMPIGNGDLAANFWVEPSGDLVFYLSKSDSWDADQELLKLGRVRIRLDKPFVRDGRPFRQELDLARGCIVVESGAGNDKNHAGLLDRCQPPGGECRDQGCRGFHRPSHSRALAEGNLFQSPEAEHGHRENQHGGRFRSPARRHDSAGGGQHHPLVLPQYREHFCRHLEKPASGPCGGEIPRPASESHLRRTDRREGIGHEG